MLVVPTELTENTETYGLKRFEPTEWPTLREARIHRNDCLRSVVVHSYVLRVAEGGESCLTSGDRREPEENSTLSNTPLPPRSAKPSEGEEFFIYTSLSSGSLQSPEVKHGSPPSATQTIIYVDSCLAKRKPFCGFEKLKSVGFCVLRE